MTNVFVQNLGFYRARFSIQSFFKQRLAHSSASAKIIPAFWHQTAATNIPWTGGLGNTTTKHNQLPAIIWNFYYDAKKLLQADNCIIMTSN